MQSFTRPLAQALAPIASRLQHAYLFGYAPTDPDDAIMLVLVGDVDLLTVSPLLDVVEPVLGHKVDVSVYSTDEWPAVDKAFQSMLDCPRTPLLLLKPIPHERADEIMRARVEGRPVPPA